MKTSVTVLDDWRFNEDIIGYPLQLLWFEGKPIVIARPLNQFSGHLKYTKKDPAFITALVSDITRLKGKKIEGGDVAMMMKRLKVFEFKYVFEVPVHVEPCPRCFAKLLLCPESQAAVQAAAVSSDISSAQTEGAVADRARKRSQAGHSGWTPPSKTCCTTWSVGDVVAHLERLSLAHVAEKFRTNGVDGAFLHELSEKDLIEELGLTRLQALKIKARLS